MKSEVCLPQRNAFCVDLEEWFHICGVETKYSDPESWGSAPSHVVADTEVLMRLLDETGTKGTFLTVGWVAERYPDLIRRLAEAGHEISRARVLHETRVLLGLFDPPPKRNPGGRVDRPRAP
jgi:hypothetical protein